MNERPASLFALMASSSTLLCCALPALFVAVGAGATFASIVSALPFLIAVSVYKIEISIFTLIMLLGAGYLNYRSARLPCPADPVLGRACLKTRRNSRRIYYVSAALFVVATIFTYWVPRFL